MAVASLVLGIISLVFCWCGWWIIFLSIPGIVLGAIGKKNPEKAGMAMAGLVMSIIATILGLTFTIACVACVGCGAASSSFSF